jgi:hypothetical protein
MRSTSGRTAWTCSSGVHHLDDDGQVPGQPEEVRLVKDRSGTEPGHALQHGCAGQMPRPEQLEQRHGQGLAVPLVRLPDEDPHQDLLALDPSHGATP